ncbi:GIY-YIG nuclease family protein [Streptomyces sp. ME18-1-4]|uniref:GIY-YIG nuclease family protein n=1 Tax=Streptomyces sp. ME18-1-4 TaxID=3028685 RepID=UPI0029A23CDA|nr:GIY-YIG nuclease family protein [Streptomyces sp. ME18-1-4]MDX3248250.1 GIY-YIG nuclease family protein [Streptomyces sp. ME18-1-4]
MVSEKMARDAPRATQLIVAEIGKFYKRPDVNAHLAPSRPTPRTVGNAKAAIYAFYDYDEEPIYVGQTQEGVSARVGRHLTGQRSDAVAKFVLDPFEVAEIAVWTLHDVANFELPSSEPGLTAEGRKKLLAKARKQLLDRYEAEVYSRLKAESHFGAVLNEAVPVSDGNPVILPEVARGKIIPEVLWDDRKHADIRIARRANHVARLAQLISEREPSNGLRRTLHLQAQRLEWLSNRRLDDLKIPQEYAEGEATEVED